MNKDQKNAFDKKKLSTDGATQKRLEIQERITKVVFAYISKI